MDTPAVDFLPRKCDHRLSDSSGGGGSPSKVRLRLTRGVPSVKGSHMERGRQGDRARGRVKGKGKGEGGGKGEGKSVNSNPIPLQNR
jgi:hypothetical protein